LDLDLEAFALGGLTLTLAPMAKVEKTKVDSVLLSKEVVRLRCDEVPEESLGSTLLKEVVDHAAMTCTKGCKIRPSHEILVLDLASPANSDWWHCLIHHEQRVHAWTLESLPASWH
jgi:hypothetical protein